MTATGGGIGLLCFAVVGAIMSDRRWVQILSGAYLMLYAVGVVAEAVSGQWKQALIIVPCLILLGLYVYSVEHMFDPKERK